MSTANNHQNQRANRATRRAKDKPARKQATPSQLWHRMYDKLENNLWMAEANRIRDQVTSTYEDDGSYEP